MNDSLLRTSLLDLLHALSNDTYPRSARMGLAIAEPLFLTRYIEKVGTGILDMIGLCKAAKSRAPGFRQESGQFIQTLWRPKAGIGMQVGTKSGLSRDQVEVLRNSLVDRSLVELIARKVEHRVCCSYDGRRSDRGMVRPCHNARSRRMTLRSASA